MKTHADYRAAVRWGQEEYARIVDDLGIEDSDALREMHEWARAYAQAAPLGMFLGASSITRPADSANALFLEVDARMHRGI